MPRKNKPRVHNEWFRPVERGGRKSCSDCKAKLEPGEWIWSWGEYVRAKFNNIRDVCKRCWPEVRERLIAHAGDCGCQFDLICRGASKPAWMDLGVDARAIAISDHVAATTREITPLVFSTFGAGRDNVPRLINQGLCELFARTLAEFCPRLEPMWDYTAVERFPALVPTETLPYIGMHCFAYDPLTNRFYDSEMPFGTPDWKLLPCFVRHIGPPGATKGQILVNLCAAL